MDASWKLSTGKNLYFSTNIRRGVHTSRLTRWKPTELPIASTNVPFVVSTCLSYKTWNSSVFRVRVWGSFRPYHRWSLCWSCRPRSTSAAHCTPYRNRTTYRIYPLTARPVQNRRFRPPGCGTNNSSRLIPPSDRSQCQTAISADLSEIYSQLFLGVSKKRNPRGRRVYGGGSRPNCHSHARYQRKHATWSVARPNGCSSGYCSHWNRWHLRLGSL